MPDGPVLVVDDDITILQARRGPVLDGWGFARAARNVGHQMGIVVMSAGHDARRWAEEMDAAGIVTKPFETDDLLTEVRRVLDALLRYGLGLCNHLIQVPVAPGERMPNYVCIRSGACHVWIMNFAESSAVLTRGRPR